MADGIMCCPCVFLLSLPCSSRWGSVLFAKRRLNTSKSMVIRIGKRCKNICKNVELVDAKLDYVSKAKYLGGYIVLVKHFKLSIHESCSRFYKALYDIYIFIKVKEMLTKWLMVIVNICLECVRFNHSDLLQLDRVWNSVFWKVFKTYDKDCILDIHISIRQRKLLTNKVLAGLFQISGYLQLTKLLSDNNMPDICNDFKDHLLDFFL